MIFLAHTNRLVHTRLLIKYLQEVVHMRLSGWQHSWVDGVHVWYSPTPELPEHRLRLRVHDRALKALLEFN